MALVVFDNAAAGNQTDAGAVCLGLICADMVGQGQKNAGFVSFIGNLYCFFRIGIFQQIGIQIVQRPLEKLC